VFKDVRGKLEVAREIVEKAVATDAAAREAYLKNTGERRGAIDKKVAELQVELVKERTILETKPQELSEVLSLGDVDQAMEIEAEIEATGAKVQELEHKISLLNRALPKGEPELFFAAIKAYRSKFKSLREAARELDEIDAELKQIRLELEEKEKYSENVRRSVTMAARYDGDNSTLIEIVESFEGAIDVSGHTAGNDERAKLRYIKGNPRGIETTLAGKKLKDLSLEEN
jgi:hypothetical protein